MINYYVDEKTICMNQFSIDMRFYIAQQIQAEYSKNTNLFLENILKKLSFLLRARFSILRISKLKTSIFSINLIKKILNRPVTISNLIFQINNPYLNLFSN